MYVKILNDKTYSDECYLTGYGLDGYCLVPNKEKAINFFDDEKEAIESFLDNTAYIKKDGTIEYSFFGDPNPREEEKKKKKRRKR